ncbi:MAG TPA: CPBP family intramembrane glutamic endopeptidase [Candidatus Acidoferrum sp.]|nr:CPBP family intramembrane glutamic endopeptidase [Candidatus Acidoferrum sp.]
MTGDRLTSSDKRALLLWVFAGILGALFAYKYFFQAFPEASVNFQVSREEALSRAQKFVTGLGENVSGYESTIVFNVDDNAKVYLERQLGLQEANRLMSSELNIWFWDVRFFKPQQEEEFSVRVSPAGQIISYDHKIEESRAGASLDRATAQSAAQTYLNAKLGLDLSGWDLLPEEANSNKRPNRLDWAFTWEKHGFRAKHAPYRLQVTLQGDRIGGSGEFLRVPEAWERGYQRLRSGNNTLALIFTIPYLLLLGTAVWLAIQLTKSGETAWSAALKLGALATVMLFLQSLNDWPLWGAGYDTKDSYSTFIFLQIGRALLLAAASALTITLVLPAAEPLYRKSQPGQLRLGQIFTRRGLRSKEFFSSSVVGLCLAAAHIGFIVAFYIVATRLGAWAPQELNYSDSVNTAFPWISGIAIGLLASMNEEFTFRLFAIPFFMRFTRSRWVAVIVPAFLWSFLHSNYPQEPAYIRGIEIGIIGIVAGIVMLRWGILATLIWHYTVDASLVGLLLIRSNSLYFKISGMVVAAAALAPLVFACISYLTRGGFESDEDLLNRSAGSPKLDLTSEPVSETVEVTSRRYDALAPGMIAFLSVCLLAGGALLWRLKPQSVGDYLKLSVDARSARARADQVMRQRGLDPNSFHHATIFIDTPHPRSNVDFPDPATNAFTNEYLRERIGAAGVNAIYKERVPGALWHVRYFRDSQPEEFSIILTPDGSVQSVRHTLAEEAPGAALTKEEAAARAKKFLAEEKKIDLKAWTLVESNSDKKPHRIDHTLTWQENEPLDAGQYTTSSVTDHAHARIDVLLLGDEIASYRTYIKIPEEWRRKQEERTLFRIIVGYVVPILFFLGLGLTALIVFLKNLKSETARSIPWRRIGFWSVWGLCGYLVVFLLGNRVPSFLNAYETAIPLKLMFGGIAIGALFGALFNFGGIALLFGMAWYYATRAFEVSRLPAWAEMPANYYRDALWMGLGGAAGLLGFERLLVAASTHWPTVHRSLEASFGQDFDALLPSASILGGAVVRGLFLTGLVALIASFVAAHVRQPALRIVLLLVGSLSLVSGGWGSPRDLAVEFLAQLILLSVLVFGVRYVMRFNILGCFLIVAGTSLFGGAAELLSQPDSFYRANGYALLLALVLLFAWPLVAWRMGDSARTLGALDSGL